MTNNINSAAEVVEKAWCERSRNDRPEGISPSTLTAWEKLHKSMHDTLWNEDANFVAQALADAGRLKPDLPEPTMDMADPHLAVWESGVTVHHEVVYVPHFLPLDDVELVEQTGKDLLAAAAHVKKQAEKGMGRADA